MQTSRPLSAHLTVYKPQLTSTLSIFHRITGAILASTVLFGVLVLKICDMSLQNYLVYLVAFHLFVTMNWMLWSVVNIAFLALCYHLSNGIRHLLWDMGFFLELSSVYTSGIVTIVFAALLAFLNALRFSY